MVTVLDWLIAAFILAFATLLPFVYARMIASGRAVKPRELPALQQIQAALARAAETGQAIHISPGAGSLHTRPAAPETFAGLVLAQRIAQSATKRGTIIAASNGDAVSHLAMRGMLRSTYRDAGYGEDYQPDTVHLYADNDALALAAGVGNRYAAEPMELSVTVGDFKNHYLLLGEQGRQYGIAQIAGTTHIESLAATVLTADGALLGEEIYAAEAYIKPSSLGLARLLTHDALRVLIIVSLIAVVIIATARDAGVLPANFPLLP